MDTIVVLSVAPLDAAAKKKIEKTFSAKHSNAVSFTYRCDPSIIGGLLVIDGDNYYDATIKGQLAKLKKTI